MLYKHPGRHNLHGDLFDYVIVAEDDVDAHLQAGWCLTTTEAKAGVAAVDMEALRALAAGDGRRKDVQEARATLAEIEGE